MKRLLLGRLNGRFRKLVLAYLQKYETNQKLLADWMGIQESVLSELLREDSRRAVSAYYLEMFIRKGVFTVAEIDDGKRESDKERAFWERVAKIDKINQLLAEAERLGVEVIPPLQSMIDAVKKKPE